MISNAQDYSSVFLRYNTELYIMSNSEQSFTAIGAMMFFWSIVYRGARCLRVCQAHKQKHLSTFQTPLSEALVKFFLKKSALFDSPQIHYIDNFFNFFYKNFY